MKRQRHHRTITLLAAFAVLLAIGGCAAGGLTPAPSATPVPGMPGAAQATVQGVTVQAQAAAWPGPVDIAQEVMPLKVRIDNNSGQPIRLRYDQFSLVGESGASFAALPLDHIEGEVAVRAGTYGAPRFYHRGFSVAPHYAPLYPDIDPYPGYYAWDFPYYDTYYPYWENIALPTADMYRLAIPEGVVDRGGSLDGWLFFEKVRGEAAAVVLRIDLVNADSGRRFAELRIPFSVE
jgi:hypothetical protein